MSAMQKKKVEKKFDYTSSFYSDLYDKSTLYAVLVRSPISSGTIRSITHPNLPKGYNLFTAKNIPGKNYISAFSTKFPVFASDRISYKGEPVGILTGSDSGKLQLLLQEVDITFTQDFLSDKQKKNSKKTITTRQIHHGNFEMAWNEASFQIENTYSLQFDFPSNSETNGAYCYTEDQKLIVYCPTQWASNLRKNLISVLDYNSENIYIHKTIVPLTETNSPWHTTTLAVQCALASFLTKKPIMLCLTRTEQLLYNDYRQSISICHKSAIDKDGLILGAEVFISIDAGVYDPLAKTIVDRMAVASLNAYKSNNIHIEVSAFYSQNPPASLVLEWADYHCFFAIENQMQEIARVVEKNPAEVRLQNMFPKDSLIRNFPFTLETNTFKEMLQIICDKSDFYRKYATYKLNSYNAESMRSTLPLRGMGLATAYEGNGFLGSTLNSARQSLEVSMEINGTVVIRVHAPSKTILHIWKKLASEILSVKHEDVFIDSTALQYEESELPETIPDNISVITQLIKKSCLAIQKLRFHQPLPIKVKRTFSPGRKKTWSQDNFSGYPYYTTSWITVIAEIEMKPQTYTYGIRGIWIAVDGGIILHEKYALLTIQKCVEQILSCSLKYQKYNYPTISVSFIPGTTEPKQIGELVFNALPAALCAAVSQALQCPISHFPIEPEAVHKIIKNINDAHAEPQNTPDSKLKEGE